MNEYLKIVCYCLVFGMVIHVGHVVAGADAYTIPWYLFVGLAAYVAATLARN
jgi:hypothetical protein